jgi:hypothetical protein
VRGFIDPCADEGSLMPQFINNEKPTEFSITNYPNPFNPKTQIRFSIPADGTVKIRVYSLIGEEIFAITENLVTGNYSILFDGTKHASGVYIYCVESGSFYQAKKMVLIK